MTTTMAAVAPAEKIQNLVCREGALPTLFWRRRPSGWRLSNDDDSWSCSRCWLSSSENWRERQVNDTAIHGETNGAVYQCSASSLDVHAVFASTALLQSDARKFALLLNNGTQTALSSTLCEDSHGVCYFFPPRRCSRDGSCSTVEPYFSSSSYNSIIAVLM